VLKSSYTVESVAVKNNNLNLLGVYIPQVEITYLNCTGVDIMCELDNLFYQFILPFSGWLIKPSAVSLKKNKYGMVQNSGIAFTVVQKQIDGLHRHYNKKIKILVNKDCYGVYRNIKVPIPYLLHEEQMLEEERSQCRPAQGEVYSLRYFYRKRTSYP
jgi:uncharacterized protein YbaR (Trm112 family)